MTACQGTTRIYHDELATVPGYAACPNEARYLVRAGGKERRYCHRCARPFEHAVSSVTLIELDDLSSSAASVPSAPLPVAGKPAAGNLALVGRWGH